MTILQTKILILVTLVVLSAMLVASAIRNDEWTGFVVTEVQLLVPLAIAWQVLGARKA